MCVCVYIYIYSTEPLHFCPLINRLFPSLDFYKKNAAVNIRVHINFSINILLYPLDSK